MNEIEDHTFDNGFDRKWVIRSAYIAYCVVCVVGYCVV